MIKQIIKQLNQLKVKNLYINKQGEKDQFSIIVTDDKSCYSIYLSTSKYDTDKMELSLSKKYENFNFLVEQKELIPFINTIRENLESSYCSNGVNKEKREQLIEMFKQANKVGLLQKESIEKIDNNEQSQYFFRMINKNVIHKDLEKINFFHIFVTQLTRDKRLEQSKYETKDYEMLVTNRELCEIFNVNLKEEKENLFRKEFNHMLIQEEQSRHMTNNEHKQEVVQNTKNEPDLKEHSISKKIKNIL